MSFVDRLVRALVGWPAVGASLALAAACQSKNTAPAEMLARSPQEPSLPTAVIPAAYVRPENISDVHGETPRDVLPDGTELANGQAGPEFVAVDDRFVYWTNFEDDSVVKVEKDRPGKPHVIYRSDRGTNKQIAVDRKAVYWGGSSLYKQVKATGATERFGFDSLLVYNVVPAGQQVYWVDGGRTTVQLRSMKADGSQVRAIGSAETQDFRIVIDGPSAFKGSFRLDAEDEGQIDLIPLAGGPSSPFATTGYLWGIAVDRKFVYWLEGKRLGAIKKKSRTGAGDVVTLTEGFRIVAPQALTSDEGSLYYSELGAAPGQGAIGKVSKAGGDAKRIAEHQVVPQALTVDDSFVYWVNFGPTQNGTVRKLRK